MFRSHVKQPQLIHMFEKQHTNSESKRLTDNHTACDFMGEETNGHKYKQEDEWKIRRWVVTFVKRKKKLSNSFASDNNQSWNKWSEAKLRTGSNWNNTNKTEKLKKERLQLWEKGTCCRENQGRECEKDQRTGKAGDRRMFGPPPNPIQLQISTLLRFQQMGPPDSHNQQNPLLQNFKRIKLLASAKRRHKRLPEQQKKSQLGLPWRNWWPLTLNKVRNLKGLCFQAVFYLRFYSYTGRVGWACIWWPD